MDHVFEYELYDKRPSLYTFQNDNVRTYGINFGVGLSCEPLLIKRLIPHLLSLFYHSKLYK